MSSEVTASIRALTSCCLQDRLAKLEESKRAVEGELETLRLATGKEEREKADILSAEKKARGQVRARENTLWSPSSSGYALIHRAHILYTHEN